MNIQSFTRYLNNEKKLQLDTGYYAYIETWRQWWEGHLPAFHEIKQTAADGAQISRRMASLRMPKHACEDWAALLLNDKTTVTVSDQSSAAWLLGDADQTGGLLGALQFWPNANRLVELAFRSGTGAFVLRCEGVAVRDGRPVPVPGQNAELRLDYLPAECILPLTVRDGLVEECAFASELLLGGKRYAYLQTHQLVPDQARGSQARQYRITNEAFEITGSGGDEGFVPVKLPEGVAASFETGSALPWFSLFSPAVVKNLPGGEGLGIAVFAEAVDAARQVDLAFDNYGQDLFLGGKKVFYNKRLTRSIFDESGAERVITPDAARRQQFFLLPETDPDAAADWHEYNPDLRVEANSRAVQDALNYFSFKCGLGARRYRFEASGVKTATEYTGDRQDMVQHANKHQIAIEAALLGILRVMLYAGKAVLGAPVDPEARLAIQFDDGYITDTETRRALDRADALDGFLPKYRYNMLWHGMDEQTARAAVAEAAREAGGTEEGLRFDGDGAGGFAGLLQPAAEGG